MPHQVAFSRNVLEREGALWFRVEGCSMRPFLRAGDRVLIRACSIETLTWGDVVLFTNGDSLCLHRVMVPMGQNGRRSVQTKGDTCGRWDLPPAAESIIGKGVMVQRGNCLLTLDSWSGRLLSSLCASSSILIGWGLWLKWRLRH